MKNRDVSVRRRSIYALAPIFASKILEVPIIEVSYSASRFVPLKPFSQTLKDQFNVDSKYSLMVSQW